MYLIIIMDAMKFHILNRLLYIANKKTIKGRAFSMNHSVESDFRWSIVEVKVLIQMKVQHFFLQHLYSAKYNLGQIRIWPISNGIWMNESWNGWADYIYLEPDRWIIPFSRLYTYVQKSRGSRHFQNLEKIM